jgi:hypothetical protein
MGVSQALQVAHVVLKQLQTPFFRMAFDAPYRLIVVRLVVSENRRLSSDHMFFLSSLPFSSLLF